MLSRGCCKLCRFLPVQAPINSKIQFWTIVSKESFPGLEDEPGSFYLISILSLGGGGTAQKQTEYVFCESAPLSVLRHHEL